MLRKNIRQMFDKKIVLPLFIVGTIIAVVILGSFFLKSNEADLFSSDTEKADLQEEIFKFQNETEESPGIVFEFSLPFKIEDIDFFNGEINPVGVVRFGKDQPDIGHSGIDVPLNQYSEIFAVDDGEVVQIKTAGDPWGGMGITQLLEKTAEGEGWGFIYEHLIPKEGLRVGDMVKKGEVIGTKAAPAGFTAHFQMSKLFNNFEYTNDTQCWPDYLESEQSNALSSWWNEYRESRHLRDSWNTTFEEGKYAFRGLLDTLKYPDGPQLCYPLGTDVR